MVIMTDESTAKPDGVDGRHKAGHDGGGRPINSHRYKSHFLLGRSSKPAALLAGK